MNLNELIEKNNKEFEEKFVRDDGLMDKYTWEGTKGDEFAPQPMANAIKSHLHASQLSIVEWMKEFVKEKSICSGCDGAGNVKCNVCKKHECLICHGTGIVELYSKDLLFQLNNLQ